MDTMLLAMAGFVAGVVVGVAGAHTRAALYRRQRNSYRRLWQYEIGARHDT